MARRRNLSLAAALVALVGLVVVASRAHSPTGGGATHGLSSRLIWEFVLVGFIALFVVCLPVAVWIIVSTRTDTPPSRGRKRRRVWRAAAVFVLVLAALAFGLRRLNEHRLHDKSHDGLAAAKASGPRKPGRPDKPLPFDWLPAIVILSVAGAGAVVIAYVLFRKPPKRPPTQAELAEQLSAVLDNSLDDLLAERDPRRAVIAAYARMERTLAGAGLPRAAAEAPLEYLGRVLRDLLRTSADAVARLTALFERAKFSRHEIDVGMKDEAIGALVAVRDELRAAAS